MYRMSDIRISRRKMYAGKMRVGGGTLPTVNKSKERDTFMAGHTGKVHDVYNFLDEFL